MDAMMRAGSMEEIARVTQAFLKIRSSILAELQRAYKG